MTTCPRCRAAADETDCYCRRCGRALRPYMGFWYEHGGILLLTLIAGPFSLVTVWLSRAISLRAKWLWTVGIGLFSAYLFYSFYNAYRLFANLLLSL